MHRPGQTINITAQLNIWLGYSNWSGEFSLIWMGWTCRRQADNLAVWIFRKLTFGDLVLADRGFNLHDEIASTGAVLKIPCFTKGKSRLSHCEVDTSRQLSNVRIHRRVAKSFFGVGAFLKI